MTDDKALRAILAHAASLTLGELRAERRRLARIAEQAQAALAKADAEIAAYEQSHQQKT